MQPEDQNSAPSSNLNIPDYLRSDTPVSQNKSKGPILVAVLAIVVIAAAASVIAYFSWQEDQKTAKFINAIGQLMTTKYVERDINLTTEVAGNFKETVTIDAKSDLSDIIEPKSDIVATYGIVDEKSKLSSTGQSKETSKELIILDKSSFYAKITDMTDALPKGISTDKWFYINADSGTLGYVFDPFALRLAVNNPIGQFPIGDYTKYKASELQDYISKSTIYTINFIDSDVFDGRAVSVYNADINYKQLAKLNDAINEQLGTHYTVKAGGTVSKAMFWIDDNSGKLVRFQESLTQEFDGLTYRVVLDMKLKYPKSLSISKPEDI